MAINKGLLLGASVANGLNAFLDAREKGDLQRQRQSLADFNKQMKTMQMDQSQQRLDLMGDQQKTDRLKIMTDALVSQNKPTAFQKALSEAEGAFNFEHSQDRLTLDEKDQYLYDHMKQKGYVYDPKKAEAEATKALDIINPRISVEQAERYGASPNARRDDLIGATRVDKKVSVQADRIILTDPDGGFEIVELPPTANHEAMKGAVETALGIRKSDLGASNMYLKNHVDIQSNFQSLYSAIQMSLQEPTRAKQTGGKENYVAIDQTITTAFIKMLDPGSVVREQEYARILDDMGITERFIGRVGNLVHGGYLTKNARLAVGRMAKKILQASELNKIRQHIMAYDNAVEAAIGFGLSEEEAERYGSISSGRSIVLSDGTYIDFKGMTREQLKTLHDNKKEEWLGKGSSDWEDFETGDLAKALNDTKRQGIHKDSQGATFQDRIAASVTDKYHAFNRMTSGWTSRSSFDQQYLNSQDSEDGQGSGSDLPVRVQDHFGEGN